MQEETFKSRLDTYYLATVVYGVTLALYTVVRGTLIGDTFSVVWQDPIVYLLAICSILALVTLIVAAISKRTVIVAEHELRFSSGSKKRTLVPTDIAWIGFRRERSFRGERVYPTVRIKVHNRRRALRLRPGSFERSSILARALRDFARNNNIELRTARRRAS
jgi:hypothetical protein